MNRAELIALFKSQSNPKPRTLDVDGFGTVYVKTMTAFDAAVMRKGLDGKDDEANFGRMLAFVLCDEEGSLLFDATNQEDILMLSKLPQAAQAAIMRGANEANDPGKA